MKIELLETQFRRFRDKPEGRRNDKQQELWDRYSAQEPFTGWENYKRLGGPATKTETEVQEIDGEEVEVEVEVPIHPWALCYYDTNLIVPVDDKIRERRSASKRVRYALFRWQTQHEVDIAIAAQKAMKAKKVRPRNPVTKEQEKIIKPFKDDPIVKANGGALGFGVKWDVHPLDPTKVYRRGSSIEEQWEQNLEAKELPVAAKKS